MKNVLSSYYPGINSKTYYGLYSPPLRRFLLIDHHNIFALFKTAQVLSSKINTVLFILFLLLVLEFNETQRDQKKAA